MENFEESLKARIRAALDPSLQAVSEETNEDIMSSLVRNITDLDAVFNSYNLQQKCEYNRHGFYLENCLKLHIVLANHIKNCFQTSMNVNGT